MNELSSYGSRAKIKRIVVDSFTTLTLPNHIWNRDIARRMIHGFEDIDATTLLIKDTSSLNEELEEVFVQGIIVLGYDEVGGRYLQLTKAKGSLFNPHRHYIGYKKGMGIYIKE